MRARLTLATSEHFERLEPLVSAFHREEGLTLSPQAREAALAPLLDGSPLGAIYLIGPVRGPIGYIILSFGWSIEFGGMDGFIDELYIRPSVRGRGIASEVLASLPSALSEVGLKALHLEVSDENAPAQRLYEKAGFLRRTHYRLMTRTF